MIGVRIVRSTLLALALGGCAATIRTGDAVNNPIRVPAESARKVVLNMTGPAQSSDWEAFKGEWRGAFRRRAALDSIGFDVQEGPPAPTGEPGILLAVHVHDYRYLTSGARYGFGVMTGNAYIEAKFTFNDLATGARFGERPYSTSSSAWEGVFSAMTDKQVDAIAVAVFGELKRQAATTAATPPQPPRQAAPASRPAASVAAPPGGSSAYEVERLPVVKSCQPVPKAVLTAKGPGFETYRVACANGDALSIRCEYGSCRALK
jgi:hypothetical protein